MRPIDRYLQAPSSDPAGGEKPAKLGMSPNSDTSTFRRLLPECPEVTEELIRHLDKTFPRRIQRGLPADEYRRFEGHQEILDYLTRAYEDQNKQE